MLVTKVREFIRSNDLIRSRDTVLAAVSGGADSVALLAVLCALRDELDFSVTAAHLDHGLRGDEARVDADFVGRLCLDWGVHCITEQVDTRSAAFSSKRSLEETARDLRYGFLKNTARKHGHRRIALGHTMEDQAETVLMRLMRGSGVHGISAMKPCSAGLFIRPLLPTSRIEILEFLASRKVPYREDSSNLDRAFTRNRVRHELIGILKENYNPRIIEALCSHAAILGDVEDYLQIQAREAYDHCVLGETSDNIELELTSLVAYHKCLRSYVLRETCRRLCGNLRDLSFCHIESLLKLASSGQSGDSVDLPSGIVAWLDGRRMLIGRRLQLRAREKEASEFCVPFEPGGTIWLPEISLGIESMVLGRDELRDGSPVGDAKRVLFDLDKLEAPFVVRNLNPGDRITPFGMQGSKKIQDLLVDMKVPRLERRRLAAFCDRNGLLWLVGIRRADSAPVAEDTNSVLELRVTSGPPRA